MKLKRTFGGFLAALALVVPLSGVLPGCSQPDNPMPFTAPPPPPAKSEELQVPKDSSGKAAYGASSKYQKAMERAAKGGAN